MRRKLNTENKILLVIRFKFRNFILIFISRKLLKHLSAALLPDMKCSPQHDGNFHFSWTITKHNIFYKIPVIRWKIAGKCAESSGCCFNKSLHKDVTVVMVVPFNNHFHNNLDHCKGFTEFVKIMKVSLSLEQLNPRVERSLDKITNIKERVDEILGEKPSSSSWPKLMQVVQYLLKNSKDICICLDFRILQRCCYFCHECRELHQRLQSVSVYAVA